jgi:hypothetical protein
MYEEIICVVAKNIAKTDKGKRELVHVDNRDYMLVNDESAKASLNQSMAYMEKTLNDLIAKVTYPEEFCDLNASLFEKLTRALQVVNEIKEEVPITPRVVVYNYYGLDFFYDRFHKGRIYVKTNREFDGDYSFVDGLVEDGVLEEDVANHVVGITPLTKEGYTRMIKNLEMGGKLGLSGERCEQLLALYDEDFDKIREIVLEYEVKDVNRGYAIFNFDGLDLYQIEAIGDVGLYDDDEKAAKDAERSGYCKIIPIEELPENFDRRYYGWVDTPENREAIKNYCAENNFYCNGNSKKASNSGDFGMQ